MSEDQTSPGAELDYRPQFPNRLDVPIGCIGAGFIMADCHLVAYRDCGLNPVAIASRSKERATEVAARHSIAKTYDSYRELLNDREIEVVDIAVPPDCLLEIVGEAVRADHIRGILAQKPLGTSLDEARKIVHLCNEAGKTLCVNQNMRYDQSVRGRVATDLSSQARRSGSGNDRHAGDSPLDALARATGMADLPDHVDSSFGHDAVLVWKPTKGLRKFSDRSTNQISSSGRDRIVHP